MDASWAGRRVWAPAGRGGGYAEQALAAEEEVVPLPPGSSEADAVTLGVSGAVAHFGLVRAGPAPAPRCRCAVQSAARAGAASVVVIASSAERGARQRELGATRVLDRSADGAGPAGFDAVVGVVAAPDLPSFPARLTPDGRLVAVGIAAGGLRLRAHRGVPQVGRVRVAEPGHRARGRAVPGGGRPVRRRGPRGAAHAHARKDAPWSRRSGPTLRWRPTRWSAGSCSGPSPGGALAEQRRTGGGTSA